MSRRVCLSIGVGTVEAAGGRSARFGYLDGATIAARALADWALKSGYGEANVRVVADDAVDGVSRQVDRDRVQAAVDELFPPDGDEVEHLILAFCGHGLTDANFGAISWLFSDSLRQKYRVVSSSFYAELALTGAKRITVITDACREAPNTVELMRLDAVRGLVLHGEPPDSPQLDLLAACQDGKQGYMLADPSSSEPGKCVFSGVIIDALWAEERGAIGPDGRITTTTLAAWVKSRTSARAREYRLKINPECRVEPEPAVLYDEVAPPIGPPRLQDWPAAATASPLGPPVAPPADREAELAAFEALAGDAERRRAVLGARFGASSRAGVPSADLLHLDPASSGILRDLVARQEGSERPRGERGRARRQQEKAIVGRVQMDAVAITRRRMASGVRRRLREVAPSRSSAEANLILTGAGAPVIWSVEPPAEVRRNVRRSSARVVADPQGLPVLLEIEGSGSTPVVPYEDRYVTIARDEAGDVFQSYGRTRGTTRRQPALAAIADLAAGRIGPEDVDRLAAELREGKHADPILGAICAHLYNAVADLDSIRRMAWFYADRRQPVPYDVALLGEMEVEREGGRGLVLRIPAVRERKARSSGLPPYATMATPVSDAPIGGRCPWFARGWDHVGLVRDSAAALVDGLADHAGAVRRSGFTVLPARSARVLADLWGLARHAL